MDYGTLVLMLILFFIAGLGTGMELQKEIDK